MIPRSEETTEDLADHVYMVAFDQLARRLEAEKVAELALAFIARKHLEYEFREFALDELQAEGERAHERLERNWRRR